MSKTLKWTIIGMLILVVLGSGYLVYKKYLTKSTQPQTQNTETTVETPTATETKAETDNSSEIVARFNNYKTTIDGNFSQLQNLAESDFKSGTPAIVTTTQNLLEELKKFITDNKTVLEQGGINTEEALKYAAEKQSFMQEKMNSRPGSSNQSSSSPSSQSPSSGSLSISLPFDKESFNSERMGIWPFCVHGGEHPEGHGGIDFDLKSSIEIKAAASGSVEEMMFEESENGYNIFIQHGEGFATGYIPIKDAKVQKGDQVSQGQALGTAGDDGQGYNYLHFEVNNYQKEGRVCPYLYFDSGAKSDFDSMFSQSHYPEQSSEPNICNCELVPVKK